MTKHVCKISRLNSKLMFKFQAIAEKTAKNVRGYFILPHPVHIGETVCKSDSKFFASENVFCKQKLS